MRNDTPDRQQMHEELQELAKLAGTPGPGGAREQAHEFETADSSGYVDLSAYRGDDENWIERELARAKAGVGPSGQRAIDGLAPQSMAPVALEALLAADEQIEDEAPPRRRWPLALGAVASVAAVAALAFVVTRNAPHAATKAAQAAAPPPAVTQPTATSEPTATQAPEAAEQAPSAPTATTAAAPPSPEHAAAKKPHATHASRGHASVPAAVASKPAAARPVAIPASQPKSSGDSLMDAIRASVKK
ncbi:MAG TPA: hypothetical protein VF765_16855 [Polyangiaceae bacterium]